jgi:hypothetical protein
MNKNKITKTVFQNASSKKRDDIQYEWMHYLETELRFPFDAEVNLYSYSKALADGDIVEVTGVEDIVDLYGMMMKIKKERKILYCPLAELSVVDKSSQNHKIIEAYEEWEENG